MNDARFRGFDGLRAVAILLVLMWHTALKMPFPTRAFAWVRPLIVTGWAGVDIFFALSGFLITCLLLREEQGRVNAGQAQGFSIARFYVRRALRILPIFLVVMALNFFVLSHVPFMSSVRTLAVWAERDWAQLLAYPALLGNYWYAYAGDAYQSRVLLGDAFLVTWSLCVEEHFYFLWPAFLLWCRGFRVRIFVVLGVCVGLLLLRYTVSHMAIENVITVHMVSHYRLDSILWGALAALGFEHRALPPARIRRFFMFVVTVCLATLIMNGDLSVIPPGTPLGHSAGLTLLAVGSALVLLELRGAPGSLLVRALELPPLRALGRLSYGMYLVHFWAIDLARMLVSDRWQGATPALFPLLFTLVLALTAGMAAILHFTVEKPFLALKDRFAAHP